MKQYKQLTSELRYQISAFLKADFSLRRIASELAFNVSSISREVNKNGGRKCYRPDRADGRAFIMKRESHKNTKFREPQINIITFLLEQDLSPEQISDVIKNYFGFSIAYQSIYRIIREDYFNKGKLFKKLRLRGKKNHYISTLRTSNRAISIPNRVSIDERPDEIEQRLRIGDWEIDTIHGAKHKGNLLTIVERSTRFTVMKYLPNRTAKAVENATIELLAPYKNCVYTITSDNGTEFANHEAISKALECDFYFAHPYSSWERGTNENTNGLIRQYFPKKKPLVNVTEEKVRDTMYKLNNRPRKCINFKTPAELFLNEKPVWAI